MYAFNMHIHMNIHSYYCTKTYTHTDAHLQYLTTNSDPFAAPGFTSTHTLFLSSESHFAVSSAFGIHYVSINIS